ncbi:hypothetical protein KGM_214851 [Danaus plexippus plexippus]|uniref:RING-type domain-containing protein n=1 Tax=Danaus plexippus plexippus TaxID=278856 RepID=A0A212F7T4_DANPL|nr:hypothetical protein KGM_214851 [Danaus plexippus plexippus]
MHILCTICSDIVNQAENIYVTKCGHVFHYNCLSKWIARSKSCPQCRNKVTDKCMFRFYPTISNEATNEDAATLQSRLDDAQLQLRQQKASCKEHEEKISATEAEIKKNLALLKACEKKLESRDTAIAALKEQLQYVKIQNNETNRLREENEVLKKNMQTLNGLQKVLNATSEEVEKMLEGYSDIRMVATFATALKRALCESEDKKNESRDQIQMLKQQLSAEKRYVAEIQAKLLSTEELLRVTKRKYFSLKHKRKADSLDSTDSLDMAVKQMKPDQDLNDAVIVQDSDTSNTSINTMVNRIENSESPYLSLKQSSLALTALQRHPTHPLPDRNLKPSELALFNSARNAITKKPDIQRTSIFHQKEPIKIQLSSENDPNMSLLNISYDGLGGHSKHDTFPSPRQSMKSCIPKLSAKHKLKRPNPIGSRDISKMLKKT